MFGGPKLSDEFDTITKSLDVIDERIAFVIDDNELGDALLDAVALGHQVEALKAKLGRTCVTNGVIARAGQRTVGQFVASRTNTPGVDINRLTKLDKWLLDFPILRAAFGNELTRAHAEHMRKHLDTNLEAHAKLHADQQFFVDTAARCSFEGFKTAANYWIAFVDPDGKEPKEQLDNNKFSVRTGRGGRGEISGELDAVSAQILRTAVEREAKKLRTHDLANGVERTNGQRKAAALIALVERGSAREDGTHSTPLANIVMSQTVAEWTLAVLNGDIEAGDTVPVHPTDIDGRCELIDGTPIHPFLAVHALGLTHAGGAEQPINLRRYVMNAEGRAIDVSVDARLFPEWMRTTLLVQSRGACEQHGCDSSHSWMQSDHIQPHSHGGQTRLDQGQVACQPDNRHKGATPGMAAWRDKPTPPRHKSRRQRSTRQTRSTDSDDPDGKPGLFS